MIVCGGYSGSVVLFSECSGETHMVSDDSVFSSRSLMLLSEFSSLLVLDTKL